MSEETLYVILAFLIFCIPVTTIFFAIFGSIALLLREDVFKIFLISLETGLIFGAVAAISVWIRIRILKSRQRARR